MQSVRAYHKEFTGQHPLMVFHHHARGIHKLYFCTYPFLCDYNGRALQAQCIYKVSHEERKECVYVCMCV